MSVTAIFLQCMTEHKRYVLDNSAFIPEREDATNVPIMLVAMSLHSTSYSY